MSGMGRPGLGPSSGDIIRGVLNSAANSSGPSVGASSLVTDANSALSGGPQLQRSASINTDSYMRLPASPMSFSSNNVSGSSVMDGSSIVQQSSHQEQMQKRGPQTGQEQANPLHAQKRPRIDFRQDDVLQQQVIQQLLQRQESLQLQGPQNPQLQAIIQQQRLAQRQQQQQQQHQMLQSFPQMQRAQTHNQQLRHQMSQHAVQPAPPARRSFDSGICARRLMQYMYHQRHRPPDNSILYWRKFILEYFAPRAKKRWCLSMYDNVGNHAFGVFPQTAMDAWQCDICGSKSGKGFEATFEVLPRLCQIKFDRGVMDELLFLDMPHECRLSNGIMVLEYAKAVQESVYEQVRVVREGQLRIIFTPELKILSWEFCARRHEEFLPRRLVAPQVNQLLQVAQKYQSAVNESGSAGIPQPDLQASCNMFVTAGRQLAKNLELHSLNDLGFSKRYVRCLQIAEVVNSMKDLIDFSREHKTGPIESLRNYPQQAACKPENQKMPDVDQLLPSNSLPADQSTLNKIMSAHPGMNNHMDNKGTRVLNNTAQGAVSLNNYQNLLRNSMNPNQHVFQPDALNSFSVPNQSHNTPYQGTGSSILSNASVNGLSGPNQHQLQMNSSMTLQNNLQSSQVNQHLHQQVLQQMMQEVMSNNRGTPQQTLSTPNANGGTSMGDAYGGANGAGCLAARANSGPNRNMLGMGNAMTNLPSSTMSRSNSLKSVSNIPTLSSASHNSQGDLPQNVQMPEMDRSIAQEFADNGIFGGEVSDMGYCWKI